VKDCKYLLYVFISVVFTVFSAAAPCHAGRWTRQVVAETERRDFINLSDQALAVDSVDTLHAVYPAGIGSGYLRLQYLHNDGSGWAAEIVDPNEENSVNWASVTVDSLDQPHIAYAISRGSEHYELRYATKIAGDWQISVLDTDPKSIYTPSIVLDASDHAHIAYCRKSFNLIDYEVEYISNATGSWVRSGVHLVDWVAYSGIKAKPLIALDSSGRPTISYLWEGNLMMAVRDGSSWTHELLYNPEPISTANVETFSMKASSEGVFHLSLVISVFLHGDYQLCHLTNAGGTWQSEILEETDNRDIIANAITIDAANQVHIAYSIEDEHYSLELYHACGTLGSYTTEYIGVKETRYCTIGVQSDGNVHILLKKYNGTTSEILCAQNSSGSWDIKPIDREIELGVPWSLAVNSAGDVSIAYHASGDIFIAENSAGTWESECLFFEGRIRSDRALAFDSADTLHMVYRGVSESLMYSENSSGTFVKELVDSRTGNIAALALDSSDNAHVLHLFDDEYEYVCYPPEVPVPGFCTGHNYYLYHSTNAGGTWAQDFLEYRAVKSGSIAVDSFGKSHVVYSVNTDNQIVYKSNASGTWALKQTIPLSKYYGYVRIAIDSADKVHIVYLDSSGIGSVLHHYTNAAGYWDDEVVDDISGLSEHLSLAVDSTNHLHICYSSGETLKYATDVSGSWQMENVADSVEYPYPSIAVDAAGVYISYYDDQTKCLMYATDTLPSKAIEVEPLSLSFIANEGGYSTLPVVVRNVGNQVLKVGAASITGDDAGQFSKTDSLPISLAVDGTTQIDVTFDPTGLGSFDAQLIIPSDDPDIPVVTVDLHGVCFALPGPYLEIVPPKNWEGFGEVIVGQTSVTAPFTIKNNSSTYTFTITSGVTVFDTDNFHVVPSPYPGACPGIKIISLPPGERCSVGVTFTPTTVGDFDSILRVYANNPFSAEAVALLEGTGIPVPEPDLLVGPSEHAFGPQQIKATSEDLVIDVGNVGDADLKISAITHLNDPNFILDLDGGKYPIGSSFPVDMAPGEVRNFTVSFYPQQIGNLEDTVTVTSYTNGQVLLSGEGTHWNLCDFDTDGNVDLGDFAILANHWMEKVEGWPPDVTPDPLDGRINLFDLYVFAKNWLESL